MEYVQGVFLMPSHKGLRVQPGCHHDEDSGDPDPLVCIISTKIVVIPRILPRTNGTAQSCHQGALGAMAQGWGQAMLMDSNNDQ